MFFTIALYKLLKKLGKCELFYISISVRSNSLIFLLITFTSTQSSSKFCFQNILGLNKNKKLLIGLVFDIFVIGKQGFLAKDYKIFDDLIFSIHYFLNNIKKKNIG